MKTETRFERVYICVDDTDDLTKTTSTGSIADEIGRRVRERFGCEINMGITRHQLLLDERVPYTSHNSSMCFDVVIPAGAAEETDKIGWEVIHARRAESSNPGLCVLPAGEAEISLEEICRMYDGIIRFGARAKKELIMMEEARDTAQNYPEMILKSEGDSGQGMIGALAGVGLRMTGDDGRFRGKYDLSKVVDGEVCPVCQLAEAFLDRYGIKPAFAAQGKDDLDPRDRIVPAAAAKAVLRSGRLTFICDKNDRGIWQPRSKDEFNKRRKKRDACDHFELDPDQEERFHDKKRRTCGSCLYRRLTEDGYLCMAGYMPVSEDK